MNLTLTFKQIRPDIGTNTRIHIRPEKGTNKNTEIHIRPDKGPNTNTHIQIRPDKGTNTKIQIRPHKGTNTNIKIQIRPDKYTNTKIQIRPDKGTNQIQGHKLDQIKVSGCETRSLRISSAGKTDLDSGKRKICSRNDFPEKNDFLKEE